MDKQTTESSVKRIVNEMVSNFDYKSFIKRGFIEVIDKITRQKVRLNGSGTSLEFLFNDVIGGYLKGFNDGTTSGLFMNIPTTRGGQVSIGETSTGGYVDLIIGDTYKTRLGIADTGTGTQGYAYFKGDFIPLDDNTWDIGSTAKKVAKVIAGDDIFVETIGKGFVLKSPDGTRYRLKVANDGTLSTEAY